MIDGKAPLLDTREKGAPGQNHPIFRNEDDSVVIAVVIVVIPIAFGVPAMLVFIPPSMDAVPAVLPRIAQFPTRALGLPALVAMPCHGLVQFVICACNAPLAIVFVGAQKGHCREHQKAGQHRRSEDRFPDE
jgi:hypothetical protein